MAVETKSNTSQFRKSLAYLIKREVLVGIPAANATRDPDPGEKVTATNALLGYVHEYGSPARNIPPRPFLHPGVLKARAGSQKHMKKAGQLALHGEKNKVDQELDKVGLVAREGVILQITNGPFEPLKPATLAARRRKGRTRTKPLIDTGQMREAITYIVK